MQTETEVTERGIRALLPWFGAGRMIAKQVGEELRGCTWVGVPFAGGMSELMEIEASVIVASDLHRHAINLASVVKNPDLYPLLREQVDKSVFHPDMLAEAQEWCKQPREFTIPSLRGAYYFFVSAWMGRSHRTGAVNEFNGGLSTRWNANGGDSCKRYCSAVRSLALWHRVFRRCSFHVKDAFEFLAQVRDSRGHGLYIDAPWPDDGTEYRHKFTNEQQEGLRDVLEMFEETRVVVRFGDHPLIRELYTEDHWTWRELPGRTQTNQKKSEVLLINGPSYAKPERTGGLFDG